MRATLEKRLSALEAELGTDGDAALLAEVERDFHAWPHELEAANEKGPAARDAFNRRTYAWRGNAAAEAHWARLFDALLAEIAKQPDPLPGQYAAREANA